MADEQKITDEKLSASAQHEKNADKSFDEAENAQHLLTDVQQVTDRKLSVNKKAEFDNKRQAEAFKKLSNNEELRIARQELKDEFLDSHPRYASMSEDELGKEMQKHSIEEDKIRKQKLRNHIETFSDGVIAVIITIMLLEIPMPTTDGGYWNFLSAVGIFLVSFIVIANFWFNHHKTFAITEQITEGVIVQDFIFMGLLSLIPLLTKWIMVQPTSFSAINYGMIVLFILVQQELLSRSIMREHFHHMPKTFHFWQKIWASRLIFTLLVNVVITIIAVAFPDYGHWLFIVVPIFNFFFRMWGDKGQQLQPNGGLRGIE
ncbi:TMEM175 family protein [Lactococcus allomyrinae]|uniref:TMEM175 family protein n=1 Tax=Lactococcus allomyrinae TaxID=2419773 RepID=UPI001F0972F7|nr:TMEM175 family protein [Lactococcus allomyrinae]